MLLIFHLSDIHLRGSASGNPVLDRARAIVSVPMELELVRVRAPTDVVVVISGDIAYGGQADEYVLADHLIAALRSEIEQRFKRTPTFIISAGNHDCDFTLPSEIRDAVLKGIEPTTVGAEIENLCANVQVHFESFRARHSPVPVQKTALYAMYELALSCRRRVRFNVVNSSWMSTMKEQQSGLLMPVARLTPLAQPHDCVMSISVFHHPYNWFESNNAKGFKSLIESCSNIVLTGHEHDAEQYRKTSPSSSQDYLAGSALQQHGPEPGSGFHVLAIDLHSEVPTQSTLTAEWDGQVYSASVISTAVPLFRDKDEFRRKFPLSEEFEEFLEDPGIGLDHPSTKLTLQKVFVYPDLLESEINVGADRTRAIREQHVDGILSRRRVLVLGDEQSGKTALAKQLCYDLHRRGIIPIYVSGRDLKRANAEEIDGWLSHACGRQYKGTHAWRDFVQAPAERRAIVVDDLHFVTAGSQIREQLCVQLTNLAECVVMFSAEHWGFDELQAARIGCDTLWSFRRYRLQEMGYAKRGELITQWCQLGDPMSGERRATFHQISAAEKHVDTVIKNDLLPAYPGNVLILLSLLAATGGGTASSRTPAVLFESLVTSRLQSAKLGAASIDTMYSYLALFAFELFSKGVRDLSGMEFRSWHQEFCRRFTMDLDSARMLRDARNAQLMTEYQGRIGFKYPYAYFYFVARHLSRKLKDEDVRQTISALGSCLHKEDASNIMLFLCYLSPDDIVVNTIIEAAKNRFQALAEFDLDKVRPQLLTVTELPERYLPMTSPADNRRADRERQDDAASAEAELRASEAAEVQELHGSLKTIELLGEVLRKYPGSIEGPVKQALAEQAYGLALRTTEFWFDVVEKHKEDFLALLCHAVSKRYGEDLSEEDIRGNVQKWFVQLAAGWTTYMIRHVSMALGSDALSPTFAELAHLHARSKSSYAAIDLSIKLDVNLTFPKEEIGQLAQRLQKNYFGTMVLQNLVLHHLRLFPVARADAQFAASKLKLRSEAADGARFDARSKKLPSR